MNTMQDLITTGQNLDDLKPTPPIANFGLAGFSYTARPLQQQKVFRRATYQSSGSIQQLIDFNKLFYQTNDEQVYSQNDCEDERSELPLPEPIIIDIGEQERQSQQINISFSDKESQRDVIVKPPTPRESNYSLQL